MKRPTIFLTHGPDALANYYGPRALAGLEQLGEVRRPDRDQNWTDAALAQAARGCDVIVSYRNSQGTAALFDQLPQLIVFSRCAVDIRNIDVAAASERGILVTQASAGFMASVSEWIVGVMIDLARGISAAMAQYQAGTMPTPVMGRELRGATVGVIGYGQIARYLIDVLRALQMHVLVTDPFAKVDGEGLRQVPLNRLLAESDYVVCLATATTETENLMDAETFAAMKPGALFINASRGNLVDEAALLHALDSGHLAGCALDVGRAPDQMPTPELARHPRVIATPHIGGLTPAAIEHQSLETVRQVAEIVQGRAPPGAVNADQAHRLRKLVDRTDRPTS